MTESTSAKTKIGQDTAFFLVMLAVSVLATVLGFWIAERCFSAATGFTLSFVKPYDGCHLPIEYLARCGVLCRPLLADTALLLLIACSRFDYPISCTYFLLRGIAFGIACFVSLRAVGVSTFPYLPIVYIAITLMYLIYARMLRTRNGPCPRSDALVFAMIASGAASLIFTAVSVSIS